MGKRILAVSWLNGGIKAVAMNGRAVVAVWESPARIELVAELTGALREAVAATRFQGTEVVFLLEHRNLLYHLQETPPAQGGVLRKLLERAVAKNRFFEEDAVWGFTELPVLKNTHRTLLNLAPRSLVQGIAAACEEVGLQLGGVFPTAAVLHQQLRTLPLAAKEPVLLASFVEGNLCLVAVTAGGSPLFARSLTGSGPLALERAEQEIKRTLLFTQQQFGVNIARVCLFGDALNQLLGQSKARDAWTFEPSPVTEDAFYFAREAAGLPLRLSTNLYAGSAASARRWRLPLAATAAALLALALPAAIVAEVLVRRGDTITRSLDASRQRNADRASSNEARILEKQRLETLLQLATKADHPPLPGLFLHQLATSLPEGLALTALDLERTPSGWALGLEGTSTNSDMTLVPQLQEFEASLTNSVFRVEITNSVTRRLFHGDEVPPHRYQNLLRNGEGRPFFLEGMIP